MKEPISFLGKYDSTKREMRKVVMQTAEPDSTREATGLMVKIFNSTYAKADLKQVVDNSTQQNFEEITLLLILLEEFMGLFDVTLCDWATESVDLYLNPDYKTFNSRYYPLPEINKETFGKDLKRLLEIVVITPVQQIQYGNPIFMIPKK